MVRYSLALVSFAACWLLPPVSAVAAPVTIDLVMVGDVGNPVDPRFGNRYGSVDHKYAIGATEVTNAQYSAFLNEKAKSDPLRLFGAAGGIGVVPSGILRSGVSGSYVYAPKANMADKPVTLVTWYDALRFINWLHNGQGSGDTETGAYTLLGGTEIPSNELTIVVRNPGARWFLPNENEWYKAAFYQPADEGGDIDNYWLYATASNDNPTPATANAVGDISNPGSNVINYRFNADWNGQNGYVTTVGSAGPLSRSYYGTFDQSGNVSEWTETLTGVDLNGQYRGVRGGSSTDEEGEISAFQRRSILARNETSRLGFRVAAVPEPGPLVLLSVGAAVLVGAALRRKAHFACPSSSSRVPCLHASDAGKHASPVEAANPFVRIHKCETKLFVGGCRS